jgi:outer membrane translocation and assembly module TamA
MGAVSPTNKDSDIYARFDYNKFIPNVFIELYRQTRSVDKNEDYMEEYGTIIRKRTYDLNEIDFGADYTFRDRHHFETRLIYSQYNARVHYTHFLTGPTVYKPYYTYSRGFDISGEYNYNSKSYARDDLINPRGGRSVRVRLDRFINFFMTDFEYSGFMREKYKKYPYNRLYVNWIERLPVPGTEKHTLNLRGQANLIDRSVDEFYEERLGGPEQMRGYSYYSLSGRKNIMAQALWRFPIMTNIDKSFASWCFNHVYGGVFADIGKAWNGKSLNWSPKGFKRDIGAELRIDTLSFYDFPTMIEFSGAYGLDDVWIKKFDENESRVVLEKDSSSPWKFYFSVLFGFN